VDEKTSLKALRMGVWTVFRVVVVVFIVCKRDTCWVDAPKNDPFMGCTYFYIVENSKAPSIYPITLKDESVVNKAIQYIMIMDTNGLKF
jgi:hypothetical protein